MSRVVGFAHAVFLAAAVAGCAGPDHRCGSGQTAPAGGASVDLAPAPRGQMEPDVSAVGSAAELRTASGADAGPLPYRLLEELPCQCRAAAASSLANLLQSESQWVGSPDQRGKHDSDDTAALKRKIYAFCAVDERNRAAGTALETYFHLAEAEGNRDLLRRSLADVGQALVDIRTLEERGLRPGADENAFLRQQLDLRKKQVQLEQTIQQLNQQLQQMLGLETESNVLIWPAADLRVTADFVNVEAAVQEGFGHRADLALAIQLRDQLNADNLPAARSALSQINGLLGSAPGKKCLLARMLGCGDSEESELAARRQQLAQVAADRQRTTATEIRQAAAAVDGQVQQVALAKELLGSWKQRAEQLQQRHNADGVTSFDVVAAQLEAVQAETQLLHEVVQWKIAQAKLRQAKGLLAEQCGYPLP
jgi:hypothetical protein